MATLTLVALPRVAQARDPHDRGLPGEVGDSYRADALEPVFGGTPEAIQIVRESGASDWPSGADERLERRIQNEWTEDRIYGAVYSSVGLWLRYPLATARIGGRVLVPVLGHDRLAIRGTLVPLRRAPSRRVVILLDASESSNAAVPVGVPGQPSRQLPLLQAGLGALESLVSGPLGEGIELGIIAFGEGTWPLVEIGASPQDALRALARFGQAHPRGDGRSDAVCALWTAYDWLRGAPDEVDREVLLLTGGSEIPHSGRFAGCPGARGTVAEGACEDARNAAGCPATHEFTRLDGFSDVAQLASFGRQVRGELVVTPVLFEDGRNSRLYAEIARRTGGRVVRVLTASGIEALLPALVSRSIEGVFARNQRTGAESGNLLAADGRSVEGEVPLEPGANDIELRIRGERGVAGLFRFRVYSAPGDLERPLADLGAAAVPASD